MILTVLKTMKVLEYVARLCGVYYITELSFTTNDLVSHAG